MTLFRCVLIAVCWTALPTVLLAARPNIVFIMSDDHGYQAVSAYESGLNETPNIDRLAHEGVRFDRCYVTDSICAPSRAVLLTGKYGPHNGVTNNQTRFDGSQVTLPKLMQAAGYQTAMIGKWHLKSDPTGFDYWDILPGQGQYYSPDFISPAGRRVEPGYVTDVTTRLTLEWLREERDPDKPFLLLMHHKAPHRPWQPGPKHLGELADADLPEPATLLDDYESRCDAAHNAKMRISQMELPYDLKVWPPESKSRDLLYKRMSPAEQSAWQRHVEPRYDEYHRLQLAGDDRVRWMWRHYMEDYLDCIASVDDSVGEVLDYLDNAGLADNTIVVYTSDQGFYLGEHGWFDKRFMYEQSLRTPLVVRWPGVSRAAAAEGRIASNLDFAPTFLDAAGVDIPADMQGRSLRPLLTGEESAAWRQSFYYHYYEGIERYHEVERHEGVTTGQHKLISFYEQGCWELYDLRADPHELHNKAGDPAYRQVRQELEAELVRLREELKIEPPEA